MPFKISRIGHSRGRPVAQGIGKCGEITRHSASVRSVWYRLTGRLCCRRVAGVHMANPSWFKKPLGITATADASIFSETPLTRAERTELGHRRLAPQDRSGAVHADVSR